MTTPDLFRPDLDKWTADQLDQLELKPGDEHYDNARQAAERGWTAENIRPLVWPKERV